MALCCSVRSHDDFEMTPAAPHFDGFIPKAKFRGIHKHSFGSETMTMNGIKRSPKLRGVHKKALDSLNTNVESCDEEDTTPKRKRFSPSSHRFGSHPCTSKKAHCDSHVEFSDEDAEELHSPRGCKLSKSCENSVKDNDGEMKTEHSHENEQSSSAVGSDLQNPNKRSFFIVQNDGRPAEMFRTDLLDRLRKGIDANADSDDDDVPGPGLTRMTDRWRTEWSYGTQVPLQPDCTYDNEVRKSDISFQRCVQQERRTLMKEFLSKPYEELPRESLRLYESTRLDKQWLKLRNENRIGTQKAALSMRMFLEIMNALEIDCYKNIHRKLLEPLHSPSSRLGEYDEEAACDICRAYESEPDDEMVFCDGCNLCVHMSCYGLQVLPPGEWLCMKCRFCFGVNPPCILCPTIGGALKYTDRKNQWAHVACALWIHECRFGDFEKREPIICIDEIQEERWAAKCSICDTRQGACIKCSLSSCNVFFHVTCALRSGLEMRIEQDPVDDKVHMISLCSRHRSAKILENVETRWDPNQQSGSDEETEEQCVPGPLARLEQTCYQFVDWREIAKRLSLDLLYVSDVYEYWKRKRLENNGKPLIDNLQDEIKIDDLESLQLDLPDFLEISSQEAQPVSRRARGRPRKSADSEGRVATAPSSNSRGAKKMTKTVRSWVRLCNSLHKGHDLLGLVLRKTKEERKYLHANADAALLIAERTSRPVPISQRTITYLNASVEGLFPNQVPRSGGTSAEKRFVSEKPSDTQPISNASSLECIPSTSSYSCHPPSPRIPTSSQRKTGRRHTDAQPVMSRCRRSSLLRSHHSMSESKQMLLESDKIEEQRRTRRRSLRNADVRRNVESSEKRRESVAHMEMPSRNLRSTKVRLSTKPSVRAAGPTTGLPSKGTDKNEAIVLEDSINAVSLAQSSLSRCDEAKISSVEGCDDKRRCLRSSTEMRTTASKLPITWKNTSKDFANGCNCSPGNVMRVKDEEGSNEIRILRSRASLPPMFQAPGVAGTTSTASSNVENTQSRIKRRSDVPLASARTVYAL